MGLFDGLSAIVGSPFKLVTKTIESTCAIPDELLRGEFKGVAKVIIPGATVIEGAIDTCKDISDSFDK